MKLSYSEVHRSSTRLNDRRTYRPDRYEIVFRPVMHCKVVNFKTLTIFLYNFGEISASYVEQ
jgi:hypothetical protein